MALQYDIRKHQLELELLMDRLNTMEQRRAKGYSAAKVLQSERELILCMGRRVRTASSPTSDQDPYYEGPEVPQGSDFLSWLCGSMDGPASIRIRTSNSGSSQGMGSSGTFPSRTD